MTIYNSSCRSNFVADASTLSCMYVGNYTHNFCYGENMDAFFESVRKGYFDCLNTFNTNKKERTSDTPNLFESFFRNVASKAFFNNQSIDLDGIWMKYKRFENSRKGVGVAILNTERTEMVIVKEHDRGKIRGNHGFPKGAAFSYETAMEAGLREVYEETHFDISNEKFYTEWEVKHRPENTNIDFHLFVVVVDKDAFRTVPMTGNKEIERVEWVPLDIIERNLSCNPNGSFYKDYFFSKGKFEQVYLKLCEKIGRKVGF